MPKAIHNLQRFLGWLLCVFTLIAAVDRVPDPPVVTPHRDQAAAFSVSSAPLPVADQDRNLPRVRFDRQAQARPFHSNWLFESKPLLPFAPDLTRASDSSPPLSQSKH